jgi:hypothetical protein
MEMVQDFECITICHGMYVHIWKMECIAVSTSNISGISRDIKKGTTMLDYFYEYLLLWIISIWKMDCSIFFS